MCLADFVAPVGTRRLGRRLRRDRGARGRTTIAERFKAEGNDYDSILVQALGDRLAEAFAEALHARVRRVALGLCGGRGR